jgi:ABC-type antimicrobial peptide transport system permease subunit
VVQRTREFGVRMALGASAGDILALVLRQGGRAVLLGTAIGIALGFALTRVLGAAVDALQPAGVWQFAAVIATLLATAGAALVIPAARAAALRPLDALRS